MMNQICTSRTVAGLTLSAILALGVFAGCGNNASGDDVETLGTVSAPASTNGATDLSGTWAFNKELSDMPQRPDSARHWGGFRGRGEHRECPDSMQGERPSRGQMGGPITIAQTDSTVVITGPRRRSRTLYTDGRMMTPQSDRAPGGAELRASWNSEGHLVVEHKGPKGGTRTETFSLAAEGKQLVIATHLDPAGDREAKDFRRVFDAASSGN
jgi:hypothetical protein